jgi:glycosyltransferase involved in cell wall biosynthesis
MKDNTGTSRAERRSICVVVPLFNETAGLGSFHEELSQTMRGQESDYSWSVIYVVDPSPDGTADLVRTLAAADEHVSGVFLLRRAGHQLSLLAGMRASDADAVITMDGDLQHPPELIPEMLRRFADGADVVQTIRVSTDGQGAISRHFSNGFYSLMNRLSDVKIEKGGADYRLMSRTVVDILGNDIVEQDLFLRGLIPWLGLPTSLVEFTARERVAGKSKYSLSRSLSLAASGIVSFSKVPLHIGIGLGLVVCALAAVGAVAAILARFLGADIPAGWTTLVVVLALLSGVQLLCLGLIGMYVGVIFDEAKKRPLILIADTVGGLADAGSSRTAGRTEELES